MLICSYFFYLFDVGLFVRTMDRNVLELRDDDDDDDDDDDNKEMSLKSSTRIGLVFLYAFLFLS